MTGAELIQALPARLFWDVDPTRLDSERDAVYIIARIMDRGTRPEVNLAWSYYGDDRIKKILLRAPCLERRTIPFFFYYFDLPPSAFKAFVRGQRQQAWSL